MATKNLHSQRPTVTADADAGRPAVPATSAAEVEAVTVVTPVAPAEPGPVTVIESVAGIPVRRVAVKALTLDACAHEWERGRQAGVQTYRCSLCGVHKPR